MSGLWKCRRVLLLALCAGLLVTEVALAQVWYVVEGGAGSQDGSSWDNAFAQPQDAVAVASSGHEVWVAAGTYTDDDVDLVVLQMADDIAIYGGFAGTESSRGERDWATNSATLDGETVCRHVVVGASNAVLDGFTVTGGNASGATELEKKGAGMYNSSVSALDVLNCTFLSNDASYRGGGVKNRYSSDVTFVNCTFQGNSSECGAGMYNLFCDAAVLGCRFESNTALDGGGMSNKSASPDVTGCTFSWNAASNQGGGMDNNDDSSPTVMDCVFRENTAQYGGGGMMNLTNCSPVVTSCAFVNNSLSGLGNFGGGLENVTNCSPTLTNCTFIGNSALNGAGMDSVDSCYPVLANCTFSGNQAEYGGALANWNSFPTLTNCILWGNAATVSAPEVYNSGAACTITYSLIEGGWSGTGNIVENPLFVDVVSGDLHLQQGSPCIDAADGTAAPTFDKDGRGRVNDASVANTGTGTPNYVDIGAYEYGGPPPVLTVTVPNDEEYWVLEASQSIEWSSSTSAIAYVGIELSRDGGATWKDLAPAVPNTGSYTWEVVGPLSDQCRIRVSDAADGDPSDDSNEDFFIVGGSLTVTLSPTQALEGDGILVDAGTVTVSPAPAGGLVVSLASADELELTVPVNVTILAGQSSVSFDVTVIDDADSDGAAEVGITATAVGYGPGSSVFTVVDDEAPPPPPPPPPPGGGCGPSAAAPGAASFVFYALMGAFVLAWRARRCG